MVSIGGNGPVPVGSAEKVADILEHWIGVTGIDSSNIGYVISPGSFEDLVDLLIPELRKRGVYPAREESGTLRERVHGLGQSRLRDDHPGFVWRYSNYPMQK